MSRLSAALVRERVRGSILERIGDTPLVPLRRIWDGSRGQIWAKLESANPGGSVKDRPGLWMVIAAEEERHLLRGKTALDATSGNTGIALAMVCAVRGHTLELCMPDKVSEERKKIVRAFGGSLVLTDPLEGTDAAIAMTRRLAREEGIFSGVSGGAAVVAALAVAREEGGHIVVLIADGGERYLSTPLWE